MVKTKILVVDDETAIRRFLRASFPEDEYDFLEAVTGKEGIQSVATHKPHVILLDLGLPDMDGVEIVTSVRSWSDVPILVLSARDMEADKVRALDAGADDYLTKPFGVPELLARIRVLMRNYRPSAEQANYTCENFQINFTSREVNRSGAPVHVTPIEYDLLAFFVRHQGRVLTHKQILSAVWGAAYANQNQYLRVFMKHLRSKLEDDPSSPKMFLTEIGVGYRFKGS